LNRPVTILRTVFMFGDACRHI